MANLGNARVLIAGCGVAGPVIALLLKKKGYKPIVLEKVRELGDAGASLLMFPNGLKVLSKLGLADFVTTAAPHLTHFCDRDSCGTDLGISDLPQTFVDKYGFPGCGVKRSALNLELKHALAVSGIPVYEAWKLKEVYENADGVVATSEDGEKLQGSFLIGCDGIKAVSRSLVLRELGIKEGEAEYTGLTQTAGISSTPQGSTALSMMLNIYGPDAHFICYPVSPCTTSWAITQRDPIEASETWKLSSASELLGQKTQLLAQFNDWCSPVPELIQGAERIIKYGLYDRPQLEPEQWFSPKGRIVLIGDAAHPTSPHLGQGANQALEDCYHLDRLLPDISNGKILSSNELIDQFSIFANLRQPRNTALVKGARANGEIRVVSNIKACLERNERLRKSWQDTEAVEAKYAALFREPY